MAYTISEIKILAYNCEEKPDFTAAEKNLFCGLAYCYECFRAGYNKEECEKLMQNYINFYENSRLRELKQQQKRGDAADG